jgi:uncharacterized protein YndB with AHSA1/START domain
MVAHRLSSWRQQSDKEVPMIADRIEREIRIEAPIEVVWSVITEPAQISQWFANEVDIETRPGAEGTFTFVNRDTGKVSSYNVHVERIEPPYHFAFRWVYPDGVEPDSTNAPLVEFTLAEEESEVTRLTLVESGIRAVDWDESEKERYYAEHKAGWEFMTGRLEEYAVSRVVR